MEKACAFLYVLFLIGCAVFGSLYASYSQGWDRGAEAAMEEAALRGLAERRVNQETADVYWEWLVDKKLEAAEERQSSGSEERS